MLLGLGRHSSESSLTGVPHRCSTHSLRAPWLLALVLLVASLHCCHGDHHGIHCKTVQRKVPGIFLNVLRGTRDGECFLDANRKAISKRHTCTAQTCCVASDCGPAADLRWICRCDGRCAANRCNLVVGSCGVLPPPNGGKYIAEGDGYVRLQCLKGYRRVGPIRRQCRKAAWFPDIPHKCLRRCKIPVPPRNGFFVTRGKSKLKKFYIHSEELRGQCSPGYRVNNGRKFLSKCKHGEWKPSMDQIQCVDDPNNLCCNLPTPPPNGGIQFLSGRNTSLCQGQAFTYFCNECYKLTATRSHEICIERNQNFTIPQCTRISCSVNSVPVPTGAYVSQDIIDPTARYDCLAGVLLRCRGVHDGPTSHSYRMQCHTSGQWIVPAGHRKIQCTPSAALDIRIEETSTTTVRISWSPPSILPRFTSAYDIMVKQGSLAGSVRPQFLRIPTDDVSHRTGDRYHATIRNLAPATLCDITITSVSGDGVPGGSDSLKVTTNALSAVPFRCESREDTLYAIWQESEFPSSATFIVSYVTTEAIASPYLRQKEISAGNASEVSVLGVQPFTEYNINLRVRSSTVRLDRRINCSLSSNTIVPRPPPSPEIRLTEGRFVASVKPSLDLFVESYILVVRKKSAMNIIQDSKKYDFTAAEVHSPPEIASRARDFIVRDFTPSSAGGETYDFVVIAMTPLKTKSASKKFVYTL